MLQADEACDGGMPRSCTADCARVYIPFHTRCAGFMRAQMPTQLAMFNAIRAECQATLNEEEAFGAYSAYCVPLAPQLHAVHLIKCWSEQVGSRRAPTAPVPHVMSTSSSVALQACRFRGGKVTVLYILATS
eukprot:COSAG02_NODE_13687_length_1362_cov_1.306413_2_plen_132_part_00